MTNSSVGVLVFAVIVGSVGNVVRNFVLKKKIENFSVSTMNRSRAEHQQLNDGIKFYMNYRQVSDTMQKRVLDCIHYMHRHAQIQDEQVGWWDSAVGKNCCHHDLLQWVQFRAMFRPFFSP